VYVYLRSSKEVNRFDKKWMNGVSIELSTRQMEVKNFKNVGQITVIALKCKRGRHAYILLIVIFYFILVI